MLHLCHRGPWRLSHFSCFIYFWYTCVYFICIFITTVNHCYDLGLEMCVFSFIFHTCTPSVAIAHKRSCNILFDCWLDLIVFNVLLYRNLFPLIYSFVVIETQSLRFEIEILDSKINLSPEKRRIEMKINVIV